jgi:hypothetical protein
MGLMATGVADSVTFGATPEVVEGREFSRAAVGGVVETTTVVRTVTVDVTGSVDRAATEDMAVVGSTIRATVLGVDIRSTGVITDVETVSGEMISATVLSGDDIAWPSGVGV